jgi:hypothetical protein
VCDSRDGVAATDPASATEPYQRVFRDFVRLPMCKPCAGKVEGTPGATGREGCNPSCQFPTDFFNKHEHTSRVPNAVQMRICTTFRKKCR